MKDRSPQLMDFPARFQADFLTFLKSADLVIFDTHFTEANLKMDWGHSTPERALEICAKAEVKTLALFHHAPEDSDEEVRDKVRSITEQARQKGVQVIASREGLLWSPT